MAEREGGHGGRLRGGEAEERATEQMQPTARRAARGARAPADVIGVFVFLVAVRGGKTWSHVFLLGNRKRPPAARAAVVPSFVSGSRKPASPAAAKIAALFLCNKKGCA
jgi:hypothetical protein